VNVCTALGILTKERQKVQRIGVSRRFGRFSW
jgi:hypothetical protein